MLATPEKYSSIQWKIHIIKIYFTWYEKIYVIKISFTKHKFFWLNENLFWYHEKKGKKVI